MLLAQQTCGQGGWVGAGGQGGGCSIGHVVDGAKIQLGELWRVEEGVAVGWLQGEAPEVPLRICVWEVVKGMSRVLAEKVESPSRLHVPRGQPGASGHGLVHRVSGCGERREHPAHIPSPAAAAPAPVTLHCIPTPVLCALQLLTATTKTMVWHTQHPQIPPRRTGNPSCCRSQTKLGCVGFHTQGPLSTHTPPCTHR